MRIVSYNILDGGEGRADPLAEVLLAQNADVIGLVECQDESVLRRLGRRLQMEIVVATAGRDPVALLSRWPIVQTIDHAAFRRGFTGSFLEAHVQRPDKSELPIGVVHLSAKATEEREIVREAEITVVLDAFAAFRKSGMPHVLCGDFNANSPTQQIDPDRCKPATRAAWESNGKMTPRRVIQRLLKCGYVDTLRDRHGEAADRSATFTTHHPGQRVDYLFTYQLQTVAAWIEQDRLATYASDHYPVGCELEKLTGVRA